MTGKIESIHEKLGKIHLLPNFNFDEPFITLDVNFTPFSFPSGPEDQYEVAIGFTEAQVLFEHPAYDVTDRYSAVIAPDVWSAHASRKQALQGRAEGSASTGFNLFGWLKVGGGVSGSAERSSETAIDATVPYHVITGNADGWQIGGLHGDPRHAEETVGDLHGFLSGTYFHGKDNEVSEQEKTASGKPKAARLHHKPGANDFRLEVTLVAPKHALRINVKPKNTTATNAEETTSSHSEKLKKALIKLRIAKELEGRSVDNDAFKRKNLHYDYVFLHRHEARGQKPPPGKAK